MDYNVGFQVCMYSAVFGAFALMHRTIEAHTDPGSPKVRQMAWVSVILFSVAGISLVIGLAQSAPSWAALAGQ